MPALAIPAIIGGVGSVASGLIGSRAAGRAADAQAQAAAQAAAIAQQAGRDAQDRVSGTSPLAWGAVQQATQEANETLGGAFLGQERALQPYMQAGQQGITTLADLLRPGGELMQSAPDPSQIANDPGYQFRMQEGIKALQRSASASGTLQSGGTLKALTQYSQGLASSEYQNAFDRFQTNRSNVVNSLSSLIQPGLNATGQYGNALQNYGNLASVNQVNAGRYTGDTAMQAAMYSGDAGLRAAGIAAGAAQNQGDARASGYVGGANAWNNAIGGATNAANTIYLGSILREGQQRRPYDGRGE